MPDEEAVQAWIRGNEAARAEDRRRDRYRAEVDASYAAYDRHPLDEPDEWGDLASFRLAAE